jgi:hypothetical protein
MISVNSSSYTAWMWRRKCLEKCGGQILLDEIRFVDDWCEKSPKNYQLWFHRRWLVEALLSRGLETIEALAASECAALDLLIDEEPKHYHGWSHRMFIAKRLGLFESMSELDFSLKYILKDVRNNSAWNHRRYAIRMHPHLASDEIAFVVEQISLCPGNESPWVYLRSLEGWSTHKRVVELMVSSTPLQHHPLLLHRDALDSLISFLILDGKPDKARESLESLVKNDINRSKILKLRLRQLPVS